MISKALNIVVPIEREDGFKIYAHSTPISRETFENYHGILSRTFSELTDDGINIVAGLATASLTLRDVAKARNAWDGPTGVQSGLINEIRRTTIVIAPGDAGMVSYTLHDAANRRVLDESEVAEVENAIVFFTLVSRMFRKAQQPMMIRALCGIGGLLTTSLSSSEYSDSLRISTAEGTSENPAG